MAKEADPDFRPKLEQVASEFGLDAKIKTGRNPVNWTAFMDGKFEGQRVRLHCVGGHPPEITAYFERSLNDVELRPRTKPLAEADPNEIRTGDQRVDELYRVKYRQVSQQQLLEWLTPERRQILVILAETFHVAEVEEGKIKVRIKSETWSANDLADAIRLCLLVAKTLDKNYRDGDQQLAS